MVANLKSLLIPIAPAPTVDTSWLDNLTKAAGSAIDTASQNKSFGRLADQIGGAPAQPQQPGFLSRLFGGGQQQAAIPAPSAQQQMAATAPQNGAAPAIPVDQGPAQGNVYQPFIQTVQNGATLPNGQKVAGVTNPYGLAAIAATGRAESSYSPQNAGGSWNDGKNNAGGIMSWNGPRLAALQQYAAGKGEAGNGSPQTQAEFLLQENPQTIAQLNAAQSPQEAANVMAKAWAFKGYDQPGGEAARRQAMTQNYYATQFKDQQPPAAAAINAAAPPSGSVVAPSANAPAGQGQTQVASLDPRAGMTGAPAAAPFDPATASPTAMMQQLGLNSPAPGQTPYRDPMVTTAGQQQPAPQQAAQSAPAAAPQQVAQSGPTTLAPGVAPVPRGSVSIPLIQSMLRDPNLRQAGLQLWEQNVTGKTSGEWDFVTLPDGTLARANKQSGEVQNLGNFQNAKKELQNVPRGGALYDSASGKWITPPEGAAVPGGGEFGLQPIYGTDATTGKTGIGQIGKDGSFHVVDTGGFQPVGNVSNTNLGTSIVTKDKAGNVIGTQTIDNAGKSAAEASGKNLAANQQALPGVLAASNQLISTIDSLASDPHLDSMLGPINSRLPTLTSDGERVKAKMDQITGQTFLQAYNQLRGGGAITDIEGEKATKSLNRLNAAQNPQDYRAALNDFREIVVNAANRARTQAGQGDGSSPAPAAGAKPTGKTTSGISWSVEQ